MREGVDLVAFRKSDIGQPTSDSNAPKPNGSPRQKSKPKDSNEGGDLDAPKTSGLPKRKSKTSGSPKQKSKLKDSLKSSVKKLGQERALRVEKSIQSDKTMRKEVVCSNSWKEISWNDPIPEEDESRYTCKWLTFNSPSGEEADICGDPNHASKNKCPPGKYFNDVWHRRLGEERPYFVDIGARNGACILQMIVKTSANIVAFGPDPQNIYRIKKTMGSIDRALRDRVTLFPIGLWDTPMEEKLYFKSEGGKSQLPIYAERLDSLLDRVKIPPKTKMSVNLEAEGSECEILDGMVNETAEKIELMRFKLSNGSDRKCTDGQGFLHKLRSEFQLDIWSKYVNDKYDDYLLPGQTPKSKKCVDLYVIRSSAVPMQNL